MNGKVKVIEQYTKGWLRKRTVSVIQALEDCSNQHTWYEMTCYGYMCDTHTRLYKFNKDRKQEIIFPETWQIKVGDILLFEDVIRANKNKFFIKETVS